MDSHDIDDGEIQYHYQQLGSRSRVHAWMATRDDWLSGVINGAFDSSSHASTALSIYIIIITIAVERGPVRIEHAVRRHDTSALQLSSWPLSPEKENNNCFLVFCRVWTLGPFACGDKLQPQEKLNRF